MTVAKMQLSDPVRELNKNMGGILYQNSSRELQNEFKVDDIEPAIEFAANLRES